MVSSRCGSACLSSITFVSLLLSGGFFFTFPSMQGEILNHIQGSKTPTSPPRAEGGVANNEVGAAKVPVGRSQSAQQITVSTEVIDPLPANAFNVKGSMGVESSGAESGQPRHRNSSGTPTSAAVTSTVTASPSRESRERAEEVARKVVRTCQMS